MGRPENEKVMTNIQPTVFPPSPLGGVFHPSGSERWSFGILPGASGGSEFRVRDQKGPVTV